MSHKKIQPVEVALVNTEGPTDAYDDSNRRFYSTMRKRLKTERKLNINHTDFPLQKKIRPQITASQNRSIAVPLKWPSADHTQLHVTPLGRPSLFCKG
jgi:hypothetical protein